VGRYRRRREASLSETFLITIVSLACTGLFFWVLIQPGMWNFGNFLSPHPSPTPLPVPAQASSEALVDLVGIAGVCAVVIGGVGLVILSIVWLRQTQRRRGQNVTISPLQSVVSRNVTTAVKETDGPAPISTRAATPDRVDAAKLSSHPFEGPVKKDSAVEAQRLLNRQEISFFWKLYTAVKDKYYIFPQIPLKQLVSPGSRKNVPRELFGMLQSGIADYVLADLSSLSAIAVVELDDPSHIHADAKARDRRKNDFLNLVDLPLIRFQTSRSWDSNLISQQINEGISAGHTIDMMDGQECAFFQILREARKDCFVFPKASLKQLVHRRDWLSSEVYVALENEVVGFLLAHPKYLSTMMVIELGGSPREDQEKELILKQAQIPLLRFPREATWNIVELRQQIQAAIRANEAK
jgi:Protein of unknown function (DUF2726)